MLSTGVFAGDGDEEDGEKENVAAVAAVATTAKLFLSRPLPPQQPPASSTTSSTSFSLPDPSRLRPLPRDLRSWGVPAPISEAYAAKCGVSLLHEWQAAALREASAGNCFVFAAPTSGGKSLVAEVLLVRQLLRARAEAENEAARAAGGGGGGGGNNGGNNGGASSSSFRPRRCRAVVALPYAALVAEKARHLASVLGGPGGGFSVKGYWAGSNAETATTADGGRNGSSVGVGGRGAPFNASAPAGSPAALLGEDVAVLTPEKLNSCVSALAARGRLSEICCVVVDEAHTVSDPSRGPVLEVAVAKILHNHYVSVSSSSSSTRTQKRTSNPLLLRKKPDPRRLQVVAMSATAARLDRLASWIGGAALFVTDVRPVPLAEFVADASTGQVFKKMTVGTRGIGIEPVPFRVLQAPRAQRPAELPLPAAAARGDGMALTALVAEAVAAREPTLVFSGSRAKAENAARMLSVALPAMMTTGEATTTTTLPSEDNDDDDDEVAPGPRSSAAASAAAAAATREKKQRTLLRLRAAAVERLRRLTAGACCNPALERCLLAGVAWHHAGLSSGERAAVEAAFREGAVLALSATSTLAAGVNLPAARVIVRSLRQAGSSSPSCCSPLLLSRSQYLQMAGRAGRAGMAPRGEAFLLIDPAERRDAAALLAAPLPPVESRLVLASRVAGLRAEQQRRRKEREDEEKKEQEQQQQQFSRVAAPLLPPASSSGFVAASSAAVAAAVVAAGAATAGGGAGGGKGGGGEEEDPLERLLLEAVACGSVRSSEDAEALVECTLARAEEQEEEQEGEEEEEEEEGEGCSGEPKQQRQRRRRSGEKSKNSFSVSSSSSAVVSAAFEALRRLRERRLVSLRSGAAVVVKEEEEEEEEEGGGGACDSRGNNNNNNKPPFHHHHHHPPPPPPLLTLALLSPTTRGLAVAAACLPTSEGERLHDELEALFSSPVPLDSLIPLIFGVLPSGNSSFPAFTVRNWAAWERALARRLSARSLRAAAALGVTREHAAGRARLGVAAITSASASASSASSSSSSSSASLDERHHRFVAAAVAAALLEEEPPEAVSAKWESVVVSALGVDAAVAAAAEAAGIAGGEGKTSSAAAAPSASASAATSSSSAPTTLMAIPLGEFQRLQAEVSQRAALGAALASAAGWGHGAALLASVSDRAAASGGGGCRPELLPLLSELPPPLLDARAARALFDAGITDVAKVARAAEERLARAFLSRVRATLPPPKQQTRQQIGNNKRPLDSSASALPPTSEPGAVWSRWATRAARAAKEAAQRRVKQEERVREELARAAEAEGALHGVGTQATATTWTTMR